MTDVEIAAKEEEISRLNSVIRDIQADADRRMELHEERINQIQNDINAAKLNYFLEDLLPVLRSRPVTIEHLGRQWAVLVDEDLSQEITDITDGDEDWWDDGFVWGDDSDPDQVYMYNLDGRIKWYIINEHNGNQSYPDTLLWCHRHGFRVRGALNTVSDQQAKWTACLGIVKEWQAKYDAEMLAEAEAVNDVAASVLDSI